MTNPGDFPIYGAMTRYSSDVGRWPEKGDPTPAQEGRLCLLIYHNLFWNGHASMNAVNTPICCQNASQIDSCHTGACAFDAKGYWIH
jgi:hypothetical protein